MTAYLVFDALRDKKIDAEADAAGEQARLEDARARACSSTRRCRCRWTTCIKGLIVQSGNDATVALAEGVGGTVEHFVELMNRQAKALGLKNTSYKNADGLTEPGHTTTARDLSILATPPDPRLPRVHAVLRDQEVPLPGHPDRPTTPTATCCCSATPPSTA